MFQNTESAKLVRRENDDRRSSGGGLEVGNCFQRYFKHFPVEDDLYDKIPSYLTVFSHSAITPLKDHNDVLSDYIVNIDNCALKRNLYSLPNCLNNYQNDATEDDYCRLPAYTMDLSQSLLYDEEFDRKMKVVNKSIRLPPIDNPTRLKTKLLRIANESIDSRKVVFLGRIPVDWKKKSEDDCRRKIESVLRGMSEPVWQYLQKIDIKYRFHNNLDSYAFIHFSESKAAFATLEYFQKNEELKVCNASLAGRDRYCNGQKYSDIDGTPSLIDKIRHF